jgi:tRNA modification GTPase
MSTDSKETIAAQATATGEAAIATIRLSGPLVQGLLRDVFGASRLVARRTVRGNYRNGNGSVLDDTLYTFFQSPHSYTGDDVAEISCHGNPLIVQKILEDLTRRGCRLAEPGEFTRLAFLNGRMDLSQAEAVIDLIRARSDRALAAAHHQLQGALGHQINSLIESLLEAIAHIEAYIDFPEEDLPAEEDSLHIVRIRFLITSLQRIAATSRYGAILREGVRTLILGAPNAGKSSLLNRLVGHERVLVSDEPGTTRDAVEERLTIGPYCIRLLDTAGIRATESRLEILSIGKTMEQVAQADLFLLILDASLPHPAFPREVLDRLSPENTIVVHNKMDLAPSPETLQHWSGLPEVFLSALTGEGIEELERQIEKLLDAVNPLSGEDFVAISARHATAIDEAIAGLENALTLLLAGDPAELAASHLREALHALGKITGRVDNEAMLDKLFATFCIGK